MIKKGDMKIYNNCLRGYTKRNHSRSKIMPEENKSRSQRKCKDVHSHHRGYQSRDPSKLMKTKEAIRRSMIDFIGILRRQKEKKCARNMNKSLKSMLISHLSLYSFNQVLIETIILQEVATYLKVYIWIQAREQRSFRKRKRKMRTYKGSQQREEATQ